MTRIIEKNVAELIMLVVITLVLMSSCGSTREMKACCERTSHEIYKYEGLTVE